MSGFLIAAGTVGLATLLANGFWALVRWNVHRMDEKQIGKELASLLNARELARRRK